MKCRFCGQELLHEAVYCNYCGKKVEEKQQIVTPDKSTGNSKKKVKRKDLPHWVKIIIIIIGTIYLMDTVLGFNVIQTIVQFAKSETSIRDIYNDEIKEELEKFIITQKKTLPMVIYDGVTMTDIELVGENIVYTAELEGALPSDYSQQNIDDIKEQILLSGVFDGKDGQLFREFGYGIIYNYVNEYNEALYKIHIYPHEL